MVSTASFTMTLGAIISCSSKYYDYVRECSKRLYLRYLCRHETNGKPTDIKVLDFQMSRRTRPAVDLVYFLGSSTTPEMREKHLEELLHFYHDQLTEILDGHGYSGRYTYTELKKDFKECFVFGFVLATSHAKVTM